MHLSRSAIVAPVSGSTRLLLVQPLTGEVAIFDGEEAARLRGTAAGQPLASTLPLADMREAGFAVESDDDERAMLAEAYATYLEEMERTPTQLIVVPTFGCNLSCTYCYQEPFVGGASGLIAPETITALFAHIDRFHGEDQPRPYLTLFGGEPLMDSPAHHDRVGRLMAGAAERGMGVAVVTNGYDVEAFLPLLSGGSVREVQVTLDGPPEIHDRRRVLHNGLGTFARVAAGIDALVAAQIPVNLRVVVDRENLPALPALARLAEERGWLNHPESAFKTQIGRNYELFGCASRQGREQLFDRLELWTAYLALAEAHPELGRFHQPRLHGMRHLAENGEWPLATFDSCPAAKKEWAFAPDGGLYGCTATVGHQKHRLGSYAPSIERDEAAIARWRERNVFSIPACQTCSMASVCGGGCGAVAVDRTGTVLAPDCRPVRELLGLGARYYRLGDD
jgi:uncharacterized protein